MVKYALSIPSSKVQEGLLAIQKEFLEQASPSNLDDLAKFVLTFLLPPEIFSNKLLLLFQSLYMLQLLAMLKSKALLLEKEA